MSRLECMSLLNCGGRGLPLRATRSQRRRPVRLGRSAGRSWLDFVPKSLYSSSYCEGPAGGRYWAAGKQAPGPTLAALRPEHPFKVHPTERQLVTVTCAQTTLFLVTTFFQACNCATNTRSGCPSLPPHSHSPSSHRSSSPADGRRKDAAAAAAAGCRRQASSARRCCWAAAAPPAAAAKGGHPACTCRVG